MTNAAENAVAVRGLAKNYGAVAALRSLDLDIGSGDYFVLLGPSGGGKTTLLRLIGGFIRPSNGRILIHGQDVTDLPPNRRPTSMVFQGFALFPHMTVAGNVGYGLRLRKLPKAEIRDRVSAMLELVGLGGYADRMPHELSGGQQQRVQLARSLILDVDILLLDEPLAALDANLRKDMCIELKRLQEKVGITFIHVTHNQEEAMTVADNLAIISAGELVESGRAIDLYETPKHRFTADFFGENNILDGRVAAVDGDTVSVDVGFGTIPVARQDAKVTVGDAVSVSIRSERTIIIDGRAADDPAITTLPATYQDTVYLGLTTSDLALLADGTEIVARRLSGNGDRAQSLRGASITIGWHYADAKLQAT